MQKISDTAMVLAAGLGMRMRPLTLTKPKPLLEVGGRAMLDYALDRLVKIGIKRAVVNAFWLAGEIEVHLKTRKDIEVIILREPELLDTGGGIKNAINYFGDKPFLSLNSDLPWFDGARSSLQKMIDVWDAGTMDCLLLLLPTLGARGFGSDGDFALMQDGRVMRKNISPPRPYICMGVQIAKPELFAIQTQKIFSNNLIWNGAEDAGRLYGTIHEGVCYHVGTPPDLAEANRLLNQGGW